MTREIIMEIVDCKECMNSACDFKNHLHEVSDTRCICEQFIKQRILNLDIAEFVEVLNERLNYVANK